MDVWVPEKSWKIILVDTIANDSSNIGPVSKIESFACLLMIAAGFIELNPEGVALEYRDVNDSMRKIFNDSSFKESINHNDQG